MLKDYSESDLADMKPMQAKQVFTNTALELNCAGENNHVKCWATARNLMPKLFVRAFPGAADAQAATLDNTGLLPAGMSYKFYLATMKLPEDTTQPEFAVAWKANGGSVLPLNAKAIMETLVGYTVGTKNVSIQAARDLVTKRFSVLAAAAHDLGTKTASASFA